MAEVLNDYSASIFTIEDTNKIHEITPAQSNLIPLTILTLLRMQCLKCLIQLK